MTIRNAEINSINRKIREGESKLMSEKRKAITEQEGCCLTCKHTKTSTGIFLICSKKDKKVKSYNYCDQWKSLLKEPKGESK